MNGEIVRNPLNRIPFTDELSYLFFVENFAGRPSFESDISPSYSRASRGTYSALPGVARCRTVEQNCTQGQCRWYFRSILHLTRPAI
jgi:hypothetical protein